jgi:predicted membrane-bound spermidine synthase
VLPNERAITQCFCAATGWHWLNGCIYACFFLSGATSLIFEVLWSREFVTIFGNSSYAISIVLCAYMAGLGLGGLAGGRLADRMKRRTMFFGVFQAVIAAWALAVPFLLARLRVLAPDLSALLPDSLLVSTLVRFTLSFAILLAPCFLMGATFPLLAREGDEVGPVDWQARRSVVLLEHAGRRVRLPGGGVLDDRHARPAP